MSRPIEERVASLEVEVRQTVQNQSELRAELKAIGEKVSEIHAALRLGKGIGGILIKTLVALGGVSGWAMYFTNGKH